MTLKIVSLAQKIKTPKSFRSCYLVNVQDWVVWCPEQTHLVSSIPAYGRRVGT